MTADELAAQLTDDIRDIERAELRQDAYRRMVVHVMTETLAWAAEQTPQVQDEKAEVGQ